MVLVSLWRGVNLGPHHRIRMEPLRGVYESLGLRDARTLLQSGNVLFRSGARDLCKLSSRVEAAFEAQFGFRSEHFLRTTAELREIAAKSPFAGRAGIDPARLAVTFLASDPDAAARARLSAIDGVPEELHVGARELYIYYPDGFARPGLTAAMLNRSLGKMGTTSRNWNTVCKLLELAAEMEAAP